MSLLGVLVLVAGCTREVEGAAVAASATVSEPAVTTTVPTTTAAPTTTAKPKPTITDPTALQGIPTCDDIARQPGLPQFTDGDHHDQDASFTAVLRECVWRSDGQFVTVQIWHYQSLPHLRAAVTNKSMFCSGEPAPPIGRSTKAEFCESSTKSKCEVYFQQGHDLVTVEWGRTGTAEETACRGRAVTLGTAVSVLLP